MAAIDFGWPIAAASLLSASCDRDPPAAPPATPVVIAPETMCDWGEAPGDECFDVGVPAGACAVGFAPDGRGGCRAVLPPADCPPGQIAVPGDLACRALESCDEAAFLSSVAGPDTQYVDGSYAGSDSDGSLRRPWITIQQGIDAAATTSIVAIKAGTYGENVWSAGKSVRIRGRCPDLVTIVAPDPRYSAVELSMGGSPALRGVTVTGGVFGVFASAVESASVEGVRAFNNQNGIGAGTELGPASLAATNVLVEDVERIGIFAGESPVWAARVMVRGAAVAALHAQLGGHLEVEQANILYDDELAVQALGAYATLRGAHVRRTAGEELGREPAVGLFPGPAGERSSVLMEGSEIDGLPLVAVFSQSSDVALTHTTFRGDAGPERVCVRADFDSTLTVDQSLYDRCGYASIIVAASGGHIQGAWLRDSLGLGILSMHESATSVRRTLIDSAATAGVYAFGASVTLDEVVIRRTKPEPGTGLFGDGVTVDATDSVRGLASLRRVAIEDSARAGVASFGGDVTLDDVRLPCNPIALNGELDDGFEFSFVEAGAIECGCAEPEACAVQSSALSPPDIDGL